MKKKEHIYIQRLLEMSDLGHATFKDIHDQYFADKRGWGINHDKCERV